MSVEKIVDALRPAEVRCPRQARKGKAVGVEANDNTNSCRKSTTGARKGCLLPSCRLVSFGVEAVKKTTQAEARKAKAPAARKAASRPAHSSATETKTRKAEAAAPARSRDCPWFENTVCDIPHDECDSCREHLHQTVKCCLCGVEIPLFVSHYSWLLGRGDEKARCCSTCAEEKVIPAFIKFARRPLAIPRQKQCKAKGGAL